MYISLEQIINLAELDGFAVDGKYYYTAALYIVKQKTDFSQMVKIIEEGNRFFFVWNGYTFSGRFAWEID
jgi:hypothetical protein